MRGLAVAVALALSLAGCAAHSPEPVEKPVSYNRRELPPSQGLFTGKDGVWTIYRSDAEPAAEPAEAEAPAPKKREILMCDRSRECEQPDASR